MARPSATAAVLLLLLFSFIAVAHCRPVEPQQPATDADSSAAAVAAGNDDENGPPKPLLPADAADQVVLPAEEGFLRLPSHRLRHHRRPCRRFPFPHHPDADEVPRHLPVFPEIGEDGEPRHVAEPDPDHSIPDEMEVAGREPLFGDADGGAHEEAIRAWKKEMMRRWFHFHHGMRHHHRLHRDEEEGHENKEEAVEGSLRRFHHRRHHEEDEEKGAMRKRFRGAEHSDDEDDEVEEIVRRFRKGIMRGRSGHGRRFHHRHHHGHRHGEEADEREEGGVVSWIKGLMNRF